MPLGESISAVVTSASKLAEQRRLAQLRAALEQNWIAQGNAGLGMADAITRNANPGLDYNHPAYYEESKPQRPAQIGTPNQTIINLERNRETIENRPHGQSIGQTSWDLDPNLANHPNNPNKQSVLAEIESRLAAIAGKPDIPAQWVSPYSQDYLNQLGDRLAGAGSEAQGQFAAAKNDIAANYQQGIDQRTAMQGGLTAALQGNGQNIGVDYAKSQGGQQAAQDVAYLSQVAETNKASDLTSNDRLGLLASQFGANLGSQAREGLLTPKEYVPGRSGVTAGDQLMADFLQNKYNQELESQRIAAEMAADQKAQGAQGSMLSDFAKTLTMGAGDEYRQNYPDVVQGLAGIADSRTMDEANRIWNITGDPAEAVKYLETTYKEDNPQLFEAVRPPVWMPSAAPIGNVDSPSYRASQQQIANYQRALEEYETNKSKSSQNQAMFQYLLDFFNQYNPNRVGVNTQRTVSNSTSEKYS